jgi:5-methylthioadenosine/S-adenosylhomocysteine deaminase
VAVHIAESADELQFVCDGTGPFATGWQQRGFAVSARARSPIALLERLGVLGPRTLAVHCVHADAADIAALAATRTAVAHCPISNAKLGHGIAPLRELLDAGVRVGLGSDSMATNNRMHLLEEARFAVMAQHARHRDPCVLGAHAALELATIGGASALGLDSRIGSLEVGKDADLAAFPLDGAAAAAEHDAEAAAVWSLGGARAVMVAVAGTELVADGAPVRRDPALAGRTLAAARALAEWSAGQGMSSG